MFLQLLYLSSALRSEEATFLAQNPNLMETRPRFWTGFYAPNDEQLYPQVFNSSADYLGNKTNKCP